MNPVLDSAVAETLLYHEQTKHHFHRYARSAGSLDWANQPNPFRCYEGVTAVKLPLLRKGRPRRFGRQAGFARVEVQV